MIGYPPLYVLVEGEAVDYDALRAAFIVACSTERMSALVRRDMLMEPVLLPRTAAGMRVLEDEASRLLAEYAAHSGVSLVIPLHNYEAFVGEAIESVLKQTRVPDEIIVVDDASTDRSLEVAARYAVQDKRVKVLHLDVNVDLACAQNTGISHTTQEHLVCLDADDLLRPTYVETLHDAMLADRSLGVAYSRVAVLMNGRILSVNEFPQFSWEWMATPANPPRTMIPKPSMFRRGFWKRARGFHQTYSAGEDVDFWLRGLAAGWNARQITEEPLFLYRKHSDSQMSRAREFKRVDHYKPWMRDHMHTFAAPAAKAPVPFDYTQPMVSIVTPVGPGHELIVQSAVESVLGQTYRFWELIVVNDTGGELQLSGYPFVRIVKPDGHGVAAARNAGIAAAKAPFVVFLDADDWFQPFALQSMLQRYVAGDAGYVYGSWLECDGSELRLKVPADYVHDLNHGRGFYAGVTTLMATEDARKLGGFDDSTRGFEDWDFYIRAAVSGICGRRVTYPTFAYRLLSGKRRGQSNERRAEIMHEFDARYGAYLNGEKPMAECCGGHGGEILKVKASLGLFTPAPEPGGARAMVKLVYVGPYEYDVMYLGKYPGSRTGTRAVDAAGDDVDRLVASGHWRVYLAELDEGPEPRLADAVQPASVVTAPESLSDVSAGLSDALKALKGD